MYKVNTPSVMYEIIDDGAIVIDGVQGLYYAINGLGAQIFSALDAGMSTQAIYEAVSQADAPDSFDISSVENFINTLVDYQIVLRTASEEKSGSSIDFKINKDMELPQVTKFDDLQELLLIDPIHQVDVEEGWPFTK